MKHESLIKSLNDKAKYLVAWRFGEACTALYAVLYSYDNSAALDESCVEGEICLATTITFTRTLFWIGACFVAIVIFIEYFHNVWGTGALKHVVKREWADLKKAKQQKKDEWKTYAEKWINCYRDPLARADDDGFPLARDNDDHYRAPVEIVAA